MANNLETLESYLPIVTNFVVLVACLCCTVVVCWLFSCRLKELGDQHTAALERLWGHITTIVSDQGKLHLREFERLHDALATMSLSIAKLTGDARLLSSPTTIGLDHARVSKRPVVLTCDDSEGIRRQVRRALQAWAADRELDVVVTPDADKYAAARESLIAAGRQIFGNVLDWTKIGQHVTGIHEPAVILTATPDAVTSDVIGMPNVSVFSKADPHWMRALPAELERLAAVVEDLRRGKK